LALTRQITDDDFLWSQVAERLALSNELKNIILKMVEYDFEKRYSNIGQIKKDLEPLFIQKLGRSPYAQKSKIALVGWSGSGKSALIHRFMKPDYFFDDYDLTMFETYHHCFGIDGQKHEMEIYEFGGNFGFELVASVCDEEDIQGFAVVYSVRRITSFFEMEPMLEAIHQLKDPASRPIILVGNMCDWDREVSVEEGEALAARFGCRFLEASAKTPVNVNEIFHYLASEIQKTVLPPQRPVLPVPNKPAGRRDNCSLQ